MRSSADWNQVRTMSGNNLSFRDCDMFRCLFARARVVINFKPHHKWHKPSISSLVRWFMHKHIYETEDYIVIWLNLEWSPEQRPTFISYALECSFRNDVSIMLLIEMIMMKLKLFCSHITCICNKLKFMCSVHDACARNENESIPKKTVLFLLLLFFAQNRNNLMVSNWIDARCTRTGCC